MWYYTPTCDYKGNSRPNPKGSEPDIGAYENALGTFVGVDEELITPKEFVLSQNYPNPFNPSTIINYFVAKESFVAIKVFDQLGREVKTLISEEKPAGKYRLSFNGSNLSSGIYFYSITACRFHQTKKMVLLR
jgi:hypothetical protein